MSTPTLRQRIHRASIALWHYRAMVPDGCPDLDDPDMFTDLLTDLQHYAAEHGIDFDECLRVARNHAAAEQAELVEAR